MPYKTKCALLFFMVLLFSGSTYANENGNATLPDVTGQISDGGIESAPEMTDIFDIKPLVKFGIDPDLLLYLIYIVSGLVITALIIGAFIL
ncbi:MAG: hypothetical protein JRI91_15415, partial [Deltaproteobacteria bacterium]|nr:hypothetical protein [Deltaproteobacteria bacterium]